MDSLPNSLEEVITYFRKFPGIGNKSALRYALLLSNWDQHTLAGFSAAIQAMGNLKRCIDCGLFCENEYCHVCLKEDRSNSAVICVIENYTDYLAIEKSGQHRGLYHVLGGIINPLMGIGPGQLGFDKLTSRIIAKNIETLILAINPSVEGDATCSYIKGLFPELKIERIGLGIPMGGHLEYLDSLTIAKALENRTSL